MAIQMMKGYGFPSARAVDFSGLGSAGGFGDFAVGEFLGGHSPEQFMKIPPLDGYGYESYNAETEDQQNDPYAEERAVAACQAAGGRWDGANGVCVTRAPSGSVGCAPGFVLDPVSGACVPAPTSQPAPAPGNTLGKVLGWGAAIYFAARWLR